jgi:hypothetical protein
VRTYSLFGWDKLGRLGQPRFYWVSVCPNSENGYLEHLGQARGTALLVPRVPTCKKLTWDTSEPYIYSSVPTVPIVPSKTQRRPHGALANTAPKSVHGCDVPVTDIEESFR